MLNLIMSNWRIFQTLSFPTNRCPSAPWLPQHQHLLGSCGPGERWMKINRSSVWTIEISKLLQAIVTSNIKPLVGTCPKVYGSEDCSVLLASDHLPRVTPHFLKSDLLQYLLLFLTIFFWYITFDAFVWPWVLRNTLQGKQPVQLLSIS